MSIYVYAETSTFFSFLLFLDFFFSLSPPASGSVVAPAAAFSSLRFRFLSAFLAAAAASTSAVMEGVGVAAGVGAEAGDQGKDTRGFSIKSPNGIGHPYD